MNKKQENNDNIAKAIGKDVGISTKMSVEVCSFIRKKNLGKAKVMLNDVINKKQAVPIKRYNKHLAHKKKIGPGRYPEKVCEEILRLLNQVEANAQFKGLSTDDLIISHIKADKASTPWHYGRQRRRKMKRTHVEVVVTEKISNKKKTEAKKDDKKVEKSLEKTEISQKEVVKSKEKKEIKKDDGKKK